MLQFARWLVVSCVLSVAGCGSSTGGGQVSGQVMVDGQVVAEGSSITFLPTDGKSPSAGALIQQGKYSAEVPVGLSKVEIRVPRPVGGGANPSASTTGPGAGGPGGGGGFIEESLPPKYNDQSELTLDVKPGNNPKDWELTTK